MKCAQKYPIVWDLSCFYDSIDSKEIKRDKKSLSETVDGFVERYGGNLTVELLPSAVNEYDKLLMKAMKIYTFVSLYYQTHITDNTASEAYQKVREWWSFNSSKLCCFIVEIQKLDYHEIKQKLSENLDFSKYRAFIENIFRFRGHTLTAPEESIMSKLGIISGGAWHKFHEGLLTRIDFFIETKKYNLSEITDLANHGESEEKRRDATISLSNGLKENEYALLSIFNNITLSHRVGNEIRSHQEPEDSRYLEDDISREIVDTMMTAISDKYSSICHRYYRIKAKILGKPKIQYWDRASKVKLSSEPEEKISYDDAIDLVLSIFKNFSQKFHDIARDMVNNGWVDVYPRNGKTSGAFSCSSTVDTHPFVLLNYFGGVRDVLTIAHEFGHAIHQRLSADNKQLVCDPALNISETASIFAEKLTNKYLLSKENDLPLKQSISEDSEGETQRRAGAYLMVREDSSSRFDVQNTRKTQFRKIELMCSRLDDIMSTIFRQAAFFKFEQIIHRSRKENELSAEKIDEIWRGTIEESLGKSVELDASINNLWGYITHFTSCPFYVYSYAFGALFVEGIYAEYEREGKGFVEKYEEALSCGGTKNPVEIASMFGIDLSSREFWDGALESIEKEVTYLENLYDKTLCI